MSVFHGSITIHFCAEIRGGKCAFLCLSSELGLPWRSKFEGKPLYVSKSSAVNHFNGSAKRSSCWAAAASTLRGFTVGPTASTDRAGGPSGFCPDSCDWTEIHSWWWTKSFRWCTRLAATGRRPSHVWKELLETWKSLWRTEYDQEEVSAKEWQSALNCPHKSSLIIAANGKIRIVGYSYSSPYPWGIRLTLTRAILPIFSK